MQPEILVRDMRPDDLAYITSAWLHQYHSISTVARKVRRPEFYPNHHDLIHVILKNPRTKILIAHYEVTPEVILGFFVYTIGYLDDVPTIHYIFVREQYKKLGIAKKLLQESNINLSSPWVFTHWTDLASEMRNKYPNGRYNPYALKL